MSETALNNTHGSDDYVRIKKKPFYIGIFLVLIAIPSIWFFDRFKDALSNWPPPYGTHKAYIAKLGCEQKNIAPYLVTKEMLQGKPDAQAFHPIGYDRRIFFDKPQCVGAIVFWDEYSGAHQKIGFYDMTTKERTIELKVSQVYDLKKEMENK